MNLSVKVDANRLTAALERAQKNVSRELRIAQAQALQIVQRGAQKNHRYRNRSGDLTRSISDPIVSRDGLRGSVKLDDGIAQYGKYIHNGFRSWAPDPFLTNSMERNKKKVIEILQTGVVKAIRKAGL